MAFTKVSPTTVREYFASIEKPLPATGRISDEAVAEYNKANKGKPYVPGQYEGKTITVTAKPAKGRTVTRKVIESQVRAAAVEAGVPVGKRGALPKEVREAYVLGTLSTLVPQPTA